jgi:hypothetical protein
VNLKLSNFEKYNFLQNSKLILAKRSYPKGHESSPPIFTYILPPLEASKSTSKGALIVAGHLYSAASGGRRPPELHP